MTEYYRYIFSYVLSRVRDFHDAEDIVQETYLTAVLKQDSLIDESKCRAWLIGIAENKVRQYFRRKTADLARFSDYPADLSSSESADDSILPTDELKELEDALFTLPEDWRQCAVVNILCGFSGAECAEILGVPPQTVYNRTHRAKKALREKLGGIMDISMEKFDLMLKQGITETERVLEHLRGLIGMITGGEHEKAASALMTASVLASDSSEAHKQIVQEIILAVRLMRLPKDHPIMQKLAVYGEREIRLIEKLGIDGVLQFDTGTAFEAYEFYNDFADFFSVTGQYSRAYEYCRKAFDTGETSKMRYAMILDDEGRYEEAAEVYLEITKDCSDGDLAMAYNRISNCMKKLARHAEGLRYQLLNLALLRSGAVYEVGSEPYVSFLAGELYFLAETYAKLGRKTEMLAALRECISMNAQYRSWALAQSAFIPYRDDDDFIEICKSGEGAPGIKK